MTATLERTDTPVVRSSLRSRPWFIPVLVGVIGFVISSIGSTIPSLWYDEAATVSSTTRSWPELWAMLGNVDAVHALYYGMTKVVFDLVGYSPLALRLPSAIAVGATAALIVIIGRRTLRPRVGVLAATVFVLLPRVTWAGTEGRSYALTALLAVAVTLLFLIARSSQRRRWWALYAVVGVIACVLFLYLALIIAAHAVTILWQLVRREQRSGVNARRWLVSAGTAGVVSLPFAAEVISQSGQVAWIEPLGAHTIRQILRAQWFYDDWLAVLAWALIALAVVALVRSSRSRTLLMVALPAIIIPTLGLVALSVLVAPIYQPRYLTMSAPFVALAIAAGIDVIRARWAGVVVIALIAGLALPHIVAQRLPEAKESTSWSEVADLIADERAADAPGTTTAIVWGNVQRHPKGSARVIAYSYPGAFEGTLDPTIVVPAAQTAQLWETRQPISASLDGLDDADVTYLITSYARDLRLETTTALATAGWTVTATWDFTNVHVIRYERDLP